MKTNPPALPLVVQLGFAGSRELLDPAAAPGVAGPAFLDQVQAYLTARLRQLPGELGLSEQHFLCGISQLAIGADTLFTQACRDLQWPQRLFLPQAREDFLAARGSDGAPDFTPEQQAVARALCASPHFIQERVVSDAPERRARFEDANIEIVRVSDVLVSVVRAGAEGKAGGTHDLMAQAARWNKPVLQISVGVRAEAPVFSEVWHWNPGVQPSPAAAGPHFTAPALPQALSRLPPMAPAAGSALAGIAAYAQTLKNHVSPQAGKLSQRFKVAAWIIIGTHVLATLCAVLALKLPLPAVVPWVLGWELVLLGGGFGYHQYLHRSETSHRWAASRLLAEVTRSVLAVGGLHAQLEYLFSLPFPEPLRPLLRTLNVLHLRSTRSTASQPWVPVRDAYLEARVKGQLVYYTKENTAAQRRLKLAQWMFWCCSGAAILVTLGKLLVISHLLPVAHDPAASVCGGLAVVLPVLAVAALSLAAAFDLMARRHTFGEMRRFLDAQEHRLAQAGSEREFARLLLETESRLLGETVNWFSRRTFTGVA